MTTSVAYLDFIDFEGNKIILTNHYYRHIIEEHGSEMTTYTDNWVDTLKYPDYFGESKSHSDCRIYVQVNNRKRNFPAKFLVIVVNGSGLITSIRFGKNTDFIKNIKEIKR